MDAKLMAQAASRAWVFCRVGWLSRRRATAVSGYARWKHPTRLRRHIYAWREHRPRKASAGFSRSWLIRGYWRVCWERQHERLGGAGQAPALGWLAERAFSKVARCCAVITGWTPCCWAARVAC